MNGLEIVFGFAKSGPDPTTLTHACKVGQNQTLCGIKIPDDWYGDAWADGPECKRCKKAAKPSGSPAPPQIEEDKEKEKMNVKALYIPKSEKGKEVARLLKQHYSYLRHEDVLGSHIANLNTYSIPHSTLAQIAFILDPERAEQAEADAEALANDIRDNPATHGIDPDDDTRIEVEAMLAGIWTS